MGFWERVTGMMANEPAQPTVARTPQRQPDAAPTPEATPIEAATEAHAIEYVAHEVALGEVIGDIAARHAVSTESVIEANGLAHPDRIYPGMQLRVPTS